MSAPVEVGGFVMPVLETMMDWALFWAGQAIPVFPLHEVYDGVCTCTCTKRCKGGAHKCGASCEAKGKHPRWHRDDLPNGVENATIDFPTIRRWWMRWPTANVGGAMGREMQLVALDFDPKNGGDLSLNDLLEAHGDAWLDTLTMKTGSGGFHFLFQYPASQVLRNSAGEVGPGVDTRADGGYIVLPPSIHASGNLYEVCRATPVIPAPEWLLEVFRPKAEAPRPINFQASAHSHARAFSGGSTIVEGERNERLFRVGCAVWGKGEVGSRGELLERLMEVNLSRVSPPLDSDEVWKIAESVSHYPLGAPVTEGAA
ncbi:MAG: bifunctional DNA primase/polymerase [Pyrinomonadaceae bacterium]